MTRLSLAEFIRVFAPAAEPRDDGSTVYRGTSGPYDSLALARLLPDGFKEVEEWEDGLYRRIWRHDEARATITYVEGDVQVTVHPDAASYEAALRRMAAFYRDH